jgi:RHS repeat-associated protein
MTPTGNTLSKRNGSGTTSYAWDFENRLTSVTLPTGGVVSFKYDPFGRRIYKNSSAGSMTYAYDGENIEEELTGSTGTLGERYTYGPGVDEPLVGQRQPQIYYYEADGLGSVTSLTDPTGALAATYTYDSFGLQTSGTGNATNWFRYTGRELDSGTGLYYYRARYYDPMAGRFLSEDPIGFSGGDKNLYRYVQDDPANLTDPQGTCVRCDRSGNALPPSYFEDLGQNANWIDNDLNLISFRRGRILDAQAYGGSQEYANYAFGVYMNAAGYSLPQALSFANTYAQFPAFKSTFPYIGGKYQNRPPSYFDPNYTNTPAINVQKITTGFNDAQNGTLCTIAN